MQKVISACDRLTNGHQAIALA